MNNLSFTFLFIFLLSSLQFFAQTNPNNDNNTQSSPLCIGCTVISSSNARDGNNLSAALFDVTGLPAGVLGFLSRDYQFPTTLPSSDEIIIRFKFTDNSLLSSLGTNVATAVIFDRLKIELMNGTTVQATYGGNGLLSNLARVDVLTPSTSTFNVIIKVPNSTTNAIRITTGALVSLGAGVSPSNLELFSISSNFFDRYYASRYTGNSGQVGASLITCINCNVFDEPNAETHNADPNSDFSKYRWDLGLALLGNEYQFIEYDWGASPILDFLGDQDGISNSLVFELQEINIVDAGLSDLGLGLWTSGGMELIVNYTDLSSNTYNNSSPLLSAEALGTHSGQYTLTFVIPPSKTVQSIELRRIAPSLGLFTELRIFNIYSVPTSILPLKLDDFAVKITDQNTTHLTWNSHQEKNLSHYQIEQSKDGVHFNTIGSVEAMNSLQQNYYDFTDLTPTSGINYYRLKMVDFDQAFSYSPIKAVEFQTEVNYQISNRQHQLQIRTAAPLEHTALISLISPDGRLLRQVVLPKGSQLKQINVADLGPLFRVQIQDQASNGYGQFVSNE